MTRHTCPGPGCVQLIAANKLACIGHWRQVPRKLRDLVYASWDRGRGAGSELHKHAIEQAIEHMKPLHKATP